MRHSRRITPVVLALSLALAACNVSSDDDSAATTAAANTTTPVSDTAGSTTTPPEPARGVTADTIKIGGAMIDIDGLKTQFGIDLGTYNPDIIPAIVAWINEEGINGRTIEYVERQFLPIGTDSSQQACRELVEDEQVFAVAGVFLDANPLCVTETYSTAYFGGFGLTPEFRSARRRPSSSPATTTEEPGPRPSSHRRERSTAKVALFYDSGAIKTIADEIVTPCWRQPASRWSPPPSCPTPVVIRWLRGRHGTDPAEVRVRWCRHLIDLTGINNLLPALEQTDYAPDRDHQRSDPRRAPRRELGLTYPGRAEGNDRPSLPASQQSIEDPVVRSASPASTPTPTWRSPRPTCCRRRRRTRRRVAHHGPGGVRDLRSAAHRAHRCRAEPDNEVDRGGSRLAGVVRVAGNPSGSLKPTVGRRWRRADLHLRRGLRHLPPEND
jgi:hypothetical protein